MYGDYPEIMKKMVGDRLPTFGPKESALVRGSLDFLGLNYYVTDYTADASNSIPPFPSVATDPRITLSCMLIKLLGRLIFFNIIYSFS